MDVTSRELREGNIRDALRGYNHDDVDELLERAAATVDELNARVAQLNERLTHVESETSVGRETQEQLSRALLVAQRTADEIVNEARETARRMVEEAEQQAANLVEEAERSAKAEIEEEARRLKADVLQLAATREALDADVNSLTGFAEELGARVREALESQIAALESRDIDVSGRPELSEVELPTPDEGIEEPVVTLERPADRAPARGGEVFSDLPHEPSTSEEPVAADEGTETARFAVVEEPEPEPEPPPAPVREPAIEHHSPLLDERFGLGPARPIESRGKDFDSGDVLEGEVLDDDTFFASLRDAVRDDSPLGPRDEELGGPETHGDLFDQEEEESRGLFRRRR